MNTVQNATSHRNVTDSTSQAQIISLIGTSENFLKGKVILACTKVVGQAQNVVRCMFVQNRPDAVRPGQSNNSLLTISMGWNNSGRMLRCWHNFDKEIFDQIGAESINDTDTPDTAESIFAKAFEVTGQSIDLSSGLGISIVEDSTPVTWIDSASGEERTQAPLINPQTNTPITSGGKEVYAHTELAVGEYVQTLILNLDKVAPPIDVVVK